MLTIGEVLPQYSSVTSYNELIVDKVHRLTDADQHWQILTDTNGVIGPDGNNITLEEDRMCWICEPIFVRFFPLLTHLSPSSSQSPQPPVPLVNMRQFPERRPVSTP